MIYLPTRACARDVPSKPVTGLLVFFSIVFGSSSSSTLNTLWSSDFVDGNNRNNLGFSEHFTSTPQSQTRAEFWPFPGLSSSLAQVELEGHSRLSVIFFLSKLLSTRERQFLTGSSSTEPGSQNGGCLDKTRVCSVLRLLPPPIILSFPIRWNCQVPHIWTAWPPEPRLIFSGHLNSCSHSVSALLFQRHHTKESTQNC